SPSEGSLQRESVLTAPPEYPEPRSTVSPVTARFTALDVHDVRFPTSDHLDGSDAMNSNPDYSAAYGGLRTDVGDCREGHALVFTTGPGNDFQVRAIEALADWVVGRSVEEVLSDMGTFSKELIYEPHLRWLGPEKGVVHMAAGAVINAAWDLRAKRAGQPVWQHLAPFEPDAVVALVDFRYLTDALAPADALEILERAVTVPREGARR